MTRKQADRMMRGFQKSLESLGVNWTVPFEMQNEKVRAFLKKEIYAKRVDIANSLTTLSAEELVRLSKRIEGEQLNN